MKKLYAAIMVVALSLAIGVTAMAQGKSTLKGAKKACCCECGSTGANAEQIRKFKADSIDLRQEVMNKRFDLQRENLKESPDATRVAAIKAEIEAIKSRINDMKTAANLPAIGNCHMEDCPLMEGNCSKCNDLTTCSCPKCKSGKRCDKSAQNCANCSKYSDSCCNKKRKTSKK